MGKLPRVACLLAITAFACFATFAAAPKAADARAAPEQSAVAADPLGRDTPLGTVMGFTKAMNAEDADRAAQYLEGAQGEPRKEQLAHMLMTVLDRAAAVQLDKLSRQPEGHLGDGLASDLEQVAVVSLQDDEDLAIVLRRVQQQGATPVWLYSAETLKRVTQVAAQLEPSLPERIWPESFRRTRIFSQPLFVWMNTLLALPLSLVVAWLLSRALDLGLDGLLRRRGDDGPHVAVARLSRPIFVLVFALLMRGVAPFGSSLTARVFWSTASSVLAVAAIAWLLVRATRLLARLKVERLRKAGQPGRIAMIELVKWSLAGLWSIGALFLILRTLGVDASAAIAGLGVGGIALAFAAQKTIADLFGTVMVVGDDALRVGDHCRLGTLEGHVQSIGLRSTRIRALDRCVVIIPNGQLAAMNIENLEMRDKFLCSQPVRLARDTTLAQMHEVLEGIRQMAREHPKVDPDTVWVRVIAFGESSLDIQMRLHLRVRGMANFLEAQEDLLLHVMEIIERAGTRLAMPGRVSYVASSLPSQQHKDERELEKEAQS